MLNISKGFTLIELAVVLFLVALVLGGVMTPLSTRIEQEERKKTEVVLAEIKESLIGYTLVNGHLPCPDCFVDGASCGTGTAITDDGFEDGLDSTTAAVTGPRAIDFNQCIVEVGYLPWATLGVSQFDAWGNRFMYSVDSNFADDNDGTPATANCPATVPATSNVSFKICSLGDMNVWENGGATPTNQVASNVSALVLSHGANGNPFGGTAPTSADEVENWWTDVVDRNFVSDDYNTSTANQYDDMVIWITPATLIYKMINAERLP